MVKLTKWDKEARTYVPFEALAKSCGKSSAYYVQDKGNKTKICHEETCGGKGQNVEIHVFGVFKASRQRQNEYAKNQKHLSLFQMINQISFIHHYELSVTAVLLKQLWQPEVPIGLFLVAGQLLLKVEYGDLYALKSSSSTSASRSVTPGRRSCWIVLSAMWEVHLRDCARRQLRKFGIQLRPRFLARSLRHI